MLFVFTRYRRVQYLPLHFSDLWDFPAVLYFCGKLGQIKKPNPPSVCIFNWRSCCWMGFSSELKYSCFQVEKKSLILANFFSCESFRFVMNSRIHTSVEMCFHVGFFCCCCLYFIGWFDFPECFLVGCLVFFVCWCVYHWRPRRLKL